MKLCIGKSICSPHTRISELVDALRMPFQLSDIAHNGQAFGKFGEMFIKHSNLAEPRMMIAE